MDKKLYKIIQYKDNIKEGSPKWDTHWVIDLNNPSIYNILTWDQVRHLCPYLTSENYQNYICEAKINCELVESYDNGHPVFYVPHDNVRFIKLLKET